MATYLDGSRRRATPNTVKAMSRSAESRECPWCRRKSAMKFLRNDYCFGSKCRWCGFARLVRREDYEKFEEPGDPEQRRESRS